jgi:hypothetical protein
MKERQRHKWGKNGRDKGRNGAKIKDRQKQKWSKNGR